MPTTTKKRRPSSPASKSARTWLIRFAIAAVAGLSIGGAGGLVTVRTLEPGRANAVDSVQAVLDSLARGTIPVATAGPRDQPPAPPINSAAPATPPSSDVVAPGDSFRTVPNVVGLEEGLARENLLAAGLYVGEVQFRASASPAGQVLATNPSAGSQPVRSGSVVLVISDGRGRADTLVIPQLPHAP